MGFVASLVGSFSFLLIGAQLFLYHLLSEPCAQAFAAIGFLSCMAAGMVLLESAERKFRGTNQA
jgi:hypothetical protein